MLSAAAHMLQARWRAAHKLSPGELASLLPAAWCVPGEHVHTHVCLHCAQDKSHWQIFTAEAQGTYSVSTRYDYNVRSTMGKRWNAENVLYYLLLSLSLLPYCWPVYTCLYRLQVHLQCYVLKIQAFWGFLFLKVASTKVIPSFDHSLPHNQQTLCLVVSHCSLVVSPPWKRPTRLHSSLTSVRWAPAHNTRAPLVLSTTPLDVARFTFCSSRKILFQACNDVISSAGQKQIKCDSKKPWTEGAAARLDVNSAHSCISTRICQKPLTMQLDAHAWHGSAVGSIQG